MVFSVFGFSQEIKTVFQSDSLKTNSYGGYGGPIIKATQVNNDWGLLIGGQGGVLINRKIALGAIGQSIIRDKDFIGDNLNGENQSPLSFVYGAGGIFFEYIFNLERPIHISIPLNLMAGGVVVNDNTTTTKVESSSNFIIEPGINLEFNLSKHFVSAINVSYRQVFGTSLVNIHNEYLSGVSMGLILKFGDF